MIFLKMRISIRQKKPFQIVAILRLDIMHAWQKHIAEAVIIAHLVINTVSIEGKESILII
jgi:hypothetical protein